MIENLSKFPEGAHNSRTNEGTHEREGKLFTVKLDNFSTVWEYNKHHNEKEPYTIA